MKPSAGASIETVEGDCCDFEFLSAQFAAFKPDAVVHYAEQPSAPYSMIGFEEARNTLTNNLNATLNLIWAVLKHAPDCHIIKLGTMGEYGTPNIDIEEGWIDIQHKGRSDKFLFPRQAGSLYHTTKVLDTDLLWFYVRIHGLRVTDLMQGPVYGLSTDEADLDPRLTAQFQDDAPGLGIDQDRMVDEVGDGRAVAVACFLEARQFQPFTRIGSGKRKPRVCRLYASLTRVRLPARLSLANRSKMRCEFCWQLEDPLTQSSTWPRSPAG